MEVNTRVDFGMGDPLYSGYLVGPPGSGKTTRIRELVRKMRKHRIFILSEDTSGDFEKLDTPMPLHIHDPREVTPEHLKEFGIHLLTLYGGWLKENEVERIFLMVVAECVGENMEQTALVIDGIHPTPVMAQWLERLGRKKGKYNNSLLIASQVINEQIAKTNQVVEPPYQWEVKPVSVDD